MSVVAEQARAWKQQAEKIQALLKTKTEDAEKAVELHEAAAARDRSNAEVAGLQDAAEIL